MKQDEKRSFFSAPRGVWEWIIILILLAAVVLGGFILHSSSKPHPHFVVLDPEEAKESALRTDIIEIEGAEYGKAN